MRIQPIKDTLVAEIEAANGKPEDTSVANVRPIDVSCPTCHAVPGMRCLDQRGQRWINDERGMVGVACELQKESAQL